MNWLKNKLKGWRTVAFNLVAALPFLLDAAGTLDLKALLGEKWGAVAGALVILGNLYLRYVTTTPVGKAQ